MLRMSEERARTGEASIGEVIGTRLSRRQALHGLAGVAAATLLPLAPFAGDRPAAAAGLTGAAAGAGQGASTLGFAELAHGLTETHAVAPGYRVQTLIRWGDPLEAGAPAFDPLAQTAEAQAKQWGYNNDYVGWMPLPAGAAAADRGLLCVNFEYTNTHLMFPGLQADVFDPVTRQQTDIELAAHGHGIVEIRRDGSGQWRVVADSPYNRRITALATPCRIAGPAAGDVRLKTAADPTGTRVIGTLNHCAGGKTPWGTVLIAEENFHQYFGGDPKKTATAAAYEQYGIVGKPEYGWFRYHGRFNIETEPNEPNRFGWMVEIDPYDPQSVPVKRTALGRFKHEGATTVVNSDGRVVAYSGDDERLEYVYRFVTAGRYDPASPQANRDLLDSGTLSVAKFRDDGSLEWLPLVHGTGPLTAANGFTSQADVLIETRRAADLLGATPMDRPEDVEPNPKTGLVYVVLTNNTKREPGQGNAANPRGPNPHGHILELIPPGAPAARDHAAAVFRWEVFLLAGNPQVPADGARYHPGVTENGWLSAPDNIAFDRQGRIWIATDGAPRFGIADGCYASDTEGPGRALTRHFYRTPTGAELCGPEFNTDDTAYFAAVQHPGEGPGSTFDQPSTRWPDFQPGMPPRPALQVIVKTDGGIIGS
jgi:hypothetical protein